MNQYELQAQDVNVRFKAAIRNLGHENGVGTARYNYEVEFAHSLNEIRLAPSYIIQKYIDKANLILASVIKDGVKK